MPNDGRTILETERLICAPIDAVFDAWTQPDLLKQWFVCTDEKPSAVTIDLRVGGRYRIQWGQNPQTCKAISGEVKHVARPVSLIVTWGWEGPAWYETLLTIEFTAEVTGTRVRLTHERFRSQADRDQHAYGWDCLLALLESLFSPSGGVGQIGSPVWGAYLAVE